VRHQLGPVDHDPGAVLVSEGEQIRAVAALRR
jgi:hypothetical protein